MSDFDVVLNRKGTNSTKWDKYRDQDIIPMWVADMDFRVPDQIIDAIKERAEHGAFGYNTPPDDLKDVIIKRMKTLYAWSVSDEQIYFLPGVVPGISQACRGLVKPDEAVVTATPIYHPFLAAPENFERDILRVPSKMIDGRWPFPVEGLRSTLAENSKASLMLLCSPYNPLSRVLNRGELSDIVNTCFEHNVTICSDEIHCELNLAGREHIPTASISREAAEITITLMAPTKTFNLAGLGGAFCIIQNEGLMERFKEGGKGMYQKLSTFAYISMLVAYRDCEPWRKELLGYLQSNCDYLAERIAKIAGINLSPVEATYLAWLDVSALGLNDPMAFFEAAGVGLSDGTQFEGPGFMRLNFACARETLVEACDRIETAIAAL
jgi:cystathionine beta-lyase